MDSRFQLGECLYRTALVSYASSVWKHPEIKKKILNCLSIVRKEEAWDYLTNEVINEFNKTTLPALIADEIRLSIKEMGKKMFYWALYVTQFLKLDIKYAMEVYWTCNGTVDTAKVIKQYWSKLKIEVGVLYEAGRCELLDYFLYNSDFDVEEVLGTTFSDRWGWDMNSWMSNLQMMLINYVLLSNITIDLVKVKLSDDCYSRLKENLDPIRLIRQASEVEKFEKAVSRGNLTATKLYFYKITDLDRRKKIKNAAYVCIRQFFSQYCNQIATRHIKEKYVEILMFLMDNMLAHELEIVMANHSSKILNMALYIWPYQEFFFSVWEKSRRKLLKVNHYISLLDLIADQILHCSRHGNCTLFYSKLFKNIWTEIPEEFRLCFLPESFVDHSIFTVVDKLFHAFDMENIKLIMNTYKGDKREKFQKISFKTFKKFLKEDKHEMFIKLREELFLTHHDRKYFICDSDFLKDFILNDEVNLIEKLLNWQFHSKLERDVIKRRLKDSLLDQLCGQCLLSFNYEQTREILEYQFKTNTGRILSLKECILRNFFSTAKRRAVKMEFYTKETHYSNTLKMILSKEFFRVGEGEQVNIPFLPPLISKITEILRRNDQNRLTNFFRYVSVEDEKIDFVFYFVIKKYILSDIEKYIQHYGLYLNSVSIVESVIKKCTSSSRRKGRYIRNCFHLREMSALCVEQYRNRCRGHLRNISNFYDFWLMEVNPRHVMEVTEEIKMMSDDECSIPLNDKIKLINRIGHQARMKFGASWKNYVDKIIFNNSVIDCEWKWKSDSDVNYDPGRYISDFDDL